MRIYQNKSSRHGHLQNIALYLFVLAVAAGLKLHYSGADSEALDWILRPTAGLTESLSGIRFEKEPLTGYISRGQRAIIAPACAGVNFLIVAFCMTAFYGIPRLSGGRGKLAWLAGALAGSLLVTVLVNALRIIVSINLYSADIYGGVLTPRGVHRAGGVLIYFTALSVLYAVSGKTLRCIQMSGRQYTAPEYRPEGYLPAWIQSPVPLFWYCAVTLGIPLLNRKSPANNPLFQDHLLTVAAACSFVFIIFLIGKLCYRYIKIVFIKDSWPGRPGYGLPIEEACNPKPMSEKWLK